MPRYGQEAVEYFAQCRHIGKIESLYFNVAPGSHYQPYTLIEVPRDKVSLLYYYVPHRAEALSDGARLTSVCLTSVACLSCTSVLSREQRGLGRLKLAQR